MDLSTFDHLLTPPGQEAISTAVGLSPRETDFLSHFQFLSRQFPPELARAALEIAILRSEAANKFPQSEKLYFTREALQQSSSYSVSRHRATRFVGFDLVIDLGCSIGGDTLALAEITRTFGLDRDPLRLRMAKANAQSLSLQIDFIQADLQNPLPIHSSQHSATSAALFFDPARRAHHRRIASVERYLPPLSSINNWLEDFPALGVKISPGVDLEELRTYDAEIEFVSYKGDLKEAVLWFGPLNTASYRATILPGPHTMTGVQHDDQQSPGREPAGYIYEPDPAILRAGLVRDLALLMDASQLDPDIAYLTCDKEVTTPFARGWKIETWFPFQLKRLRAYLREARVGKVVIKKRGSPLQPEALMRDLRLDGDAERVLFLTHLNGKPIVVIAFPNQ